MEIIWLCAFYLYTTGGYYYFSNQPTNTHFMTPWDKYVPIIPIFLIPYLFATFTFLTVPVFFYLKLGWVKTEAYLITQAIAITIGYVIYSIFPVSVIRPESYGEGLWWNFLKILHNNDGTSAAFPSGHIYQSTVIVYFCWIYLPISRPFVAVILPLIIGSTVLLKQHYLPDIAGGLITAIISIVISKYLLTLI